VGFYALSQDGDELELEHMWVDPGHMRTGVGALLLAHAVATARRLGGSRLARNRRSRRDAFCPCWSSI
jgi:GNAT superfamily N-acetyltransferase